MRIAVVTNYFPCKEQPYRGHSAYQTVRCMQRHADVEVFSPQLRYPAGFAPQHRPWAQTDISFQVPDVKTTLFDYPAVPVLSRAFNGMVCANRLEPHLKKGRFDVILNYWIYPDGFAAVRAGRRLGIPVILKAIGSDINEAQGATRVLSMAAMRAADLVMTVSNPLRDRVVGMGINPRKVKAVLNGCDTSIFHLREQGEARASLGLDAKKKYILYVGRLDAAKGLRELVRATAAVRRQMPDVHLLMIGEGPLRVELEGLIRAEGLEGAATIAGPFASEQLGAWFAACDVFALPSYNEGCPNVVIEALNSGRPVVASDVGGIPELVGDSGILVAPRDAEALAEGLERGLSVEWDFAAIARTHQRSWDEVGQEVLTMCRKVVAGYRQQREGMVAAARGHALGSAIAQHN